MKNALSISMLFLTFLSCQTNNGEGFEPVEFSNVTEWWTYHSREIDLGADFEGRSATNEKLAKRDFLDSLKSGKYIPVKLRKDSQEKIYILQKIDPTSDYAKTISQLAKTHLYYYDWENKPFPAFNFVDVEGNQYTSDNTKGKTIYLKTYFIGCQACNQEMPVLNKMVNENEQNDKLIFLSLATDEPEKLKKFLSSKDYKYKFVPSQLEFIQTQLRTNQYPTHFIIENGIVKKVTNKAEDVLKWL